MSDRGFIERIERLVHDHLDDEQFGISELAAGMGISRSQLWRKVKAGTGKSAYLFIREIRLEEAARLLSQEKYTAAEIAFMTGFSSPSYFNKCFHEKFGCTPGEYSKTMPGIAVEKDAPVRKFNARQYFIIPVVLVIVITATWLLLSPGSGKNVSAETQPPSIAVLPLMDLSENSDKEHIAFGLTDAITLELSRLQGIRVISRGSTMRYRDSLILYKSIAEQLDVDLLLEGSIIFSEDSLRVTVQLIDPLPRETHLWSNAYEQDAGNMMNLARVISSRIAGEIDLVVNEPDASSAAISVDPLAQDLYLRGRMLYEQQTPESVRKAIAYLKRSIQTDSSFAPAYTTIAECYVTLNRFTRNHEEKLANRQNSREAINKALDWAIRLDNTRTEAYMTKAYVMSSFEYNWEAMNSLVEKGLELNPNSAYGHRLKSKYLAVKGNYPGALEEARIAERLDPLNPSLGTIVANRLMLTGAYAEAVQQLEKVIELYPNYTWAWDNLGTIYFLMGKKKDALDAYTTLHRILGNSEIVAYYTKEDFDNSVRFWLSSATGPAKPLCSNPSVISLAHMLADDHEGSLEYLEYAFEVKNEDLPEMMLNPVFKDLHENPRFTRIAEQVDIHLGS